MTREQRTRQLLDVAWALVREEGTGALTLGRLAEAAGVTKPVAYDHFVTRNGLLAALYDDYDGRQTVVFHERIGRARAQLVDRAAAIASGYIDCVLSQGNEVQGILAALVGAPELHEVRRRYQQDFIDNCQVWLARSRPTARCRWPGAGPSSVRLKPFQRVWLPARWTRPVPWPSCSG